MQRTFLTEKGGHATILAPSAIRTLGQDHLGGLKMQLSEMRSKDLTTVEIIASMKCENT